MKGMKTNAAPMVLAALAGATVSGVGVWLVCRKSYDARLEREMAAERAHFNHRLKVADEQTHAAYQDADAAAREAEALRAALFGAGKSGPDGDAGVHDVADAGPDHEDDGSPTMGDSSGSDVHGDGWPGNPETRDAAVGDAGGDRGREGGSAAGSPIPPSAVVARNLSKPYVISAEEFEEADPSDDILQLKYYAGDKVLCDERDEPIQDVTGTVGLITPESFGGVSGDPNLMYVRNERLGVWIEVALDKGSYVDVVLNYGRPS